MDFEKRLRASRMRSGMTQQAVADHLGVSLRVYQNYEQGSRRPTYENVASTCRLLGVTSDYLFGLADEASAGGC